MSLGLRLWFGLWFSFGFRLQLALGPLAEALKEGQVYVTLGRLEKAGLVSAMSGSGQREILVPSRNE